MMSNDKHFVFVYGTLKRGMPNSKINVGKFKANVRTVEKYPFYIVGERFSAKMYDSAGAGEEVSGELFEVDNDGLAAMDKLERVGQAGGYGRKTIEVVDENSGQKYAAFVYLVDQSEFSQELVKSGPIKEYTSEHAAQYIPSQPDPKKIPFK